MFLFYNEKKKNKEKNENTSNVTGNANIRFEKYGWEQGWGQIEGPQEPGKKDKMVHSTYC